MKEIVLDKDILEETYKELQNQKEVAKKLDVSLKVVKKNVKRYGLNNYNHKTFIKKPEKKILYKLLIDNTREEIAKKYGVCLTTLKKWMKDYNLTLKRSDFNFLGKEQKEVVIGSALGDGHLEGRILSIEHSLKQENYLDYKRNFFLGNCSDKYYRTHIKSVRLLRDRKSVV